MRYAFVFLIMAALGGEALGQVQESVLVEQATPGEADEAKEVPASVTVIKIDPEKDAHTPITELLARTPGVQVRRYGGLGSYSTLSIRGSTPAQVTVYLDGVPLSGASGGAVNLDDFDAGSLDRIEVYRGSAPGRFAQDGIGGVIRLVTRRKHAGLAASLAAGQYRTAASRLELGKAGAGLTLFGRRGDGDFRFLDDNGTPLNPDDDELASRKNNEAAEAGGSLRLTRQRERLTLDLTAHALAKSQGVPGLGANQALRTNFSTRRLLLDAAFRLDRFAGEGGVLRGGLFGTTRRERFEDPLGEVGVGSQDRRDRFTEAGARLELDLPLAEGRHLLTALLEARRETHADEDRLLGRPQVQSGRWSLRASIEDPITAGAWELTPRLRIEHQRSDIDLSGLPIDPLDPAPASVRTLLSPSLGIRWLGQGSAFRLRANVGRSARTPGFDEMFGDQGPISGNPKLRPELGWNADLGLSYERSGWTVELIGFAAFVEDLVAYLQNSQRTFRPFNLGAARTLGLEASAAGAWGPVDLSFSCTVQDARDRSTIAYLRGNELPGRSPVHLTADASRTLGAWTARTTLEWLAPNYLDRANLHRTGARLYQGLELSLRPRGGWPSLGVELNNLWNDRTSDVGGFPLPGRSLFLHARWSSGRAVSR